MIRFGLDGAMDACRCQLDPHVGHRGVNVMGRGLERARYAVEFTARWPLARRKIVTDHASAYALCCVVDEHPRFYVEFVLWAICVTNNLPGRFRPFVYAMGKISSDLLNWAEKLGVQVIIAVPVVEGSPHSNKIRPFFDNHGLDFTIVCDADLFFVADPSGLLTTDRIRAAPNNHCNPPPRIFRSILAAAGLGRPYRPSMALYRGSEGLRETHINNISAGIVVAPCSRARELAEKWSKWANWLVLNRTLLEGWAIHVDQVSFALAMEEMREDVEFLPPHMNTILHLLGEISTCYALHLTSGHLPQFPERFGADRTLAAEGLAEPMRICLERLNRCILAAVEVISALPSTREHLDKFLNPAWDRQA